MATISGGTVRWVIEADDSGFSEAVDAAKDKATELKQTLNRDDSRNGMFSGIKSRATEATSALASLGKTISSIGWGAFSAGATAATGALTTLIAKGIQGTDFLESARTQMAGLTGSMEAGNKALSSAAKFWQNNPFDRFTTTSATTQLIQFGRSVNQISDDLDLLGDISMSTGTPLDELARYFARTAASGRAMTLDIEMMSDRGIPIYQKLSEVTGKTTQGIREMASEGKISFEIFEAALKKAVNPEAMAEFENTLARQKDRLSGSISNLAGDLAGYKIINDQLVISANGLEKAYTRLLKTLATELRGEKLRSSMEKLGKTFASIVDKIEPLIPILVDKLGTALEFVANHSATLVPILGGVLAILGRFGQNLPGIGGLIGSVSNSFTTLGRGIVSLVSKNPLLAGFIALFTTGLVNSLKTSESFRKSVSELLKSLGGLFQSLLPVIQSFVKVFVQIATSGAVTGVLQAVVKVLTLLANVLSAIPTDVLTGLVTSLLMFKMISVSPIAGLATGISLLVGAIQGLVSEMGGLEGLGALLSNIWKNITNGIGTFIKNITNTGKKVVEVLTSPIVKGIEALKSIPSTLLSIGNNIMVGLFNGLVEGSRKVKDFVVGVAKTIISTFKSVLGIHSPSTVMAEQGKYITLGLAEGITSNSSVVDKAMDALASSVVSAAEKVINAKASFGLFNYNDEYKAWKKISSLFTKGSDQYKQAMEKMEEARQSVNLQILRLQNEYNDTLDTTIDKIANMYGLFDTVDLSGGMGIADITRNLDQQVARLNEYAEAQEAISKLDLDPEFIEELMSMGVDATNELAAIAGASADQLAQLNDLWLKKQQIANRAAVKQTESLRKDTLDEIASLKEGIDGETIDVVEVGARLVSNIGDGITGALPTLESSFAQLGDFIAEQMKGVSESATESTSDVLNAEDLASTFASSLDTSLSDIKTSVESFGKGMFGIIAGVLGVSAFTKIFGKNIASKIGEKISGVFSSIGNIGKASKGIKDTVETAQEVSKVAQGVSNSSKSLVSAGGEMTKAQSAMKTIRSGILNIILLAGAIAAMGVALKVAYDMIPSDVLGLAGKLGMVAVVVAAMGALAGVAGKFDKSIKSGLTTIALIAGEIALTALALAAADVLIPDDLGNLALKLATMGLTIIAFGALATIISAIPLDMTKGLVVMAAIAGEIALVGIALGVADASIQSNFDVFMGKLGIMGSAILEFGVLAAAIGAVMSTGIGAIFLGAGLVALLGICGGIVATAVAIGQIDKQVPADIAGVNAKIELMKSVVKTMLQANFGNLFENLGNAINISVIAKVAESFNAIAETITKIGALQIDAGTIEGKIKTIEQVITALSNLSTGNFWQNLANSANTGIMTTTVNNIHDIVSKIGEAVAILAELDSKMAQGKTIEGYVTTIRKIVTQFANIQTGDFWTQLNNSAATEQIKATAGHIASIISVVRDICKDLQNLNDNYGEGKAQSLVAEAIEIMGAFKGIKTDGSSTGWFSKSTYAVVAENLGDITKTAECIGKIIEVTSGIFASLEKMNIKNKEDAEARVGKAVDVMQAFAGVTLPSGDQGWFSKNTYTRVAEDLAEVQKVAEALGSIINVATDMATKLSTFTQGGAGKVETYITQANTILQKLADIRISQEWVGETAERSNSVNTTASNVMNILTSAASIIDSIIKFNEMKANVPALVQQANTILQEIAGIQLQQTYLEETSKNASFLDTTAKNVNTILDSASGIIEKIISFNKVSGGVEAVKGYISQANQIIAKFGELNLNGDKDFEKLATSSNSLSSIVTTVKTILDSAGATLDSVRAFVKKYDLATLSEDITGENGINKVLEKLAAINVVGLGDGEMKVANLESVNQILAKVNEIATSLASIPDVADKTTNVEKIIQFINEQMTNLPTTFNSYADQFVEVGTLYADKFATGWKSQYENAVNNGKSLAGKYAEGIASTYTQFGDAGRELQQNMWSAIEGTFQAEYWQGAALAGKVIDGINSKLNEFRSAGVNATQGFVNGANSQNPYNAGWQVADKFLQGLKARGQQGSPWKTTIESGAWAVEGLIEGIAGSENALVNEATNLADNVISALDMSDASLDPSLDANINPYMGKMSSFDFGDESKYNNKRDIVIEQTNNNYSQYSVEQANRDMMWALSKV